MTFKEQFAALIDLKSIVTLGLIGATVYGFVVRIVPIEVFIALVTAVITYYFTKVVPAPSSTTSETRTTTTSETITPPSTIPTIPTDIPQ